MNYKICTKHNIGFQVIDLAYDTKDEVIQWMVETQLGRRNLTPIQRIAIAEKYRPVFKKLAEENKVKAMEKSRMENPNNQNEQLWQISATTVDKVHTRNELFKIAGASHDTYGKGKKIVDLEKENKLNNYRSNIWYNEL